jgi:VIT1/CCC1 family predicted Fe2+/Mn2+ transporter
LLAGIAGLVAGAMSMAAGEYVSVSSQSDTENADLARERLELANDPEFEKRELANIYISRGVEHGIARQVAEQLMARDAVGAHARDELGISEITTARPVQAALTSAATFSVGAAAPLALALVSPSSWIIPAVSVGSLVFLAMLGTIGAKAGGAHIVKPTIRVTFWGALAMRHGRYWRYLWDSRVRSHFTSRRQTIVSKPPAARGRNREFTDCQSR